MLHSLKLYVAILAKLLVDMYPEEADVNDWNSLVRVVSENVPAPNKHLWINELKKCLPTFDKEVCLELARIEKLVSSEKDKGHISSVDRILKLISIEPYFSRLPSPEVSCACAEEVESNMKHVDGDAGKQDSVLCLNSLSFTIAISLASKGKTVYCGMYKDVFSRVISGLFSAMFYAVNSGYLKLVEDDDVDSIRIKTSNLVYAEKFTDDEPDIPNCSRRCKNNSFLLERKVLWESSLKAQEFRSTVSGRNLVSVIVLPGTKSPKSAAVAQSCLITTSESEPGGGQASIKMGNIEAPSDKTIDISSWDLSTAIEQTVVNFVEVSPRALYSANSLDPQRFLADADLEIGNLKDFNSSQLEFIANIIRAQNIAKAESETSEDFLYTAKEVAIGDIDEFSFVRDPEKTILVSKDGEKRATQASLNDGDIVLAIKGSVGKVGLIRKPKDEKWVANQSLLIIRSRPSYAQDYPNYYLFRFLSSDFVRKYFDSRVIGAYIPSISMTDVRRLEVPLVSEEFLAEQENKLAESEEALATINKLKEKIINLKLNIHDFLRE